MHDQADAGASLVGGRFRGRNASQIADKANDRQKRDNRAFNRKPKPISLHYGKCGLHPPQGDPWPQPDRNEQGFFDRHIMIEELLYVLQHGSAEPRAYMRPVAIDGKHQNGTALTKNRLDPSKQFMHPANLPLADNNKTSLE